VKESTDQVKHEVDALCVPFFASADIMALIWPQKHHETGLFQQYTSHYI
jgi:hypothetical protein